MQCLFKQPLPLWHLDLVLRAELPLIIMDADSGLDAAEV